MNIVVTYTFLFLLIINGYGQNGREQILQTHQKEVAKILNHYKKDANPKKWKAAKFLLDHIQIHKSKVCQWIDKEGTRHDVNELKLESFEAYTAKIKNFRKNGIQPKVTSLWDVQYLKADFLIENIDTAFATWENSPWHGQYSFQTFCEYVLPYRSTIEPIQKGWRTDSQIIHKAAQYNASDPNDPIAICTEVVQQMSTLKFVYNSADPQPLLRLDQLYFRGQGSCPDLANAAVLHCRALGLPTTFDFTPYHAASSNAHYWNTIINTSGRHIPFNGSQDAPYVYDATPKRLGKALRNTFSNQKKALPNIVPFEQIPDHKLQLYNVIDVTHEYTKTINIPYVFENFKGNKVAYISVYNKGKWRPLWWGEIESNGNKVVYENMGTGIVYMPGQYLLDAQQLQLEKYPLLISEQGEIVVLKPNFKTRFDCPLTRAKEISGAPRDFNSLALKDHQKYTLSVWNDGWQFLGKKTVQHQSMSFNNLPKNALFKLEPQHPDKFERIFTIDPTTCTLIWY